MTERVAVIGAGGCAREVRWTIETAGKQFEFAGYIVSDLASLKPTDEQSEILGDFDWLEEHPGNVSCVVLGIANPRFRQSMVESITARFPELEWPTIIHPSSLIGTNGSIGRGVVICPWVIATVNVRIADFAMVHYQCTLAHEVTIGRYSTLNAGALLGGGASVGQGVLIGGGATVMQYRKVLDGATVGAGAVVTRDVAANEVVAGVPARRLSPRTGNRGNA